ncbi:hypothetical protein AMATHDRAFT_64624 [Amanita thiersii Skay4041]|uniref:DML1/Misato tubulin domain-containing protein n=1 Tax=Amanita thiersii Skay4041 TaxID=703135 RepID=A0A2A9NM72_9AGAR|nr:hypothetical protein AMATHDRAFT_64624 [Amanita thiersii Skay4041]
MGKSTYSPRALIFDRRANFGPLGKGNAFGDVDSGEEPADDETWNGHIEEHKQAVIPKSLYQSQMDETDGLGTKETEGNSRRLLQNSNEIRYWSDFNRVFYVPRSIQALPDPTYGEVVSGNWDGGMDLFARFNEETSLMEDSFRQLLEESDYFQGLHVVNDVDTFGGFTNALLTAFRDEFSKMPTLTIPLLSSALPTWTGTNTQATTMIINEALYLRSLSEISSMNLPILDPSYWQSDQWSHLVNFDNHNTYQTSAILSTLLETSTFPLRLSNARADLASFCAQLQGHGTGSFYQLAGYVPVTTSAIFSSQLLFDTLSAKHRASQIQDWACSHVTRGFPPSVITAYEEWRSDCIGRGTYVSSITAPAYPLPSSYPSIFRESDFVGAGVVIPQMDKRAPPQHHLRQSMSLPPAVSVLSSISTSSEIAMLFAGYAEHIQKSLGRGATAGGIDADETRELISDLWTLHDSYDRVY